MLPGCLQHGHLVLLEAGFWSARITFLYFPVPVMTSPALKAQSLFSSRHPSFPATLKSKKHSSPERKPSSS